jgi:hypothetical protein
MPQPASKVRWNGNHAFGTDMFPGHPNLAIVIVQVIAGWAVIEAHLGRIFAALLQGKQSVAISMYAATNRFEIQRDLLRVCARESLPPRYAKIFDFAVSVVSRAANDRHKFAHWIWGASADPTLNALLLVEPHHFWRNAAHQIRHIQQHKRRGTDPTLARLSAPKIGHEHMFVYQLKDLEEALLRVERAFQIAEFLRQLVTATGPKRLAIYRVLRQIPEIHQAYLKEQKATLERRPVKRAPRGERRG